MLLEWCKQLVQVVRYENVSKGVWKRWKEQIWVSFKVNIKRRKNWKKNQLHTAR